MGYQAWPSYDGQEWPAPPQYATSPAAGSGVEVPSRSQYIAQPDGGVLSIVGDANVVALWDAASLTASPVSSWPDASGNGRTLTGSGAARPAWNATGGPNSQPSVLFDGSDDYLTASIDRPAPGTEPTFYWAVMRQVTWTIGDRFWCADPGGGSRLALFQNTATPQIAQANNTTVNSHSGLTVNTYMRVEVYFSNSTADYVKAGSASATTGANASNTDPAGPFELGGSLASLAYANFEVCIFAIFRALPSAAQRAALDAYVTSRFGAGLV